MGICKRARAEQRGQDTTLRAFVLAFGFVLTLGAVLGVASRTALADTAYEDYLVTTDANKNKSGEDLAALRVTFNNVDWYIVEDNSSSATEGSVTLLAADIIGASSAFDNTREPRSKAYDGSTIKGVLDAMVADGGSFADVAGAINPVTLTNYQYLSDEPFYNSQKVVEIIEDAKLYLLSTPEARVLPGAVREADRDWWLRSPGYNDDAAAYVHDYGDVRVSGYGHTVGNEFGVRPACQLNLASAVFDPESNTFFCKKT